MKKRKTTDLDRYEAAVQFAPDLYQAVVFKGRGQYDKVASTHFETALRMARDLANTGRTAAVYAIRGQRSSHLLNVQKGSAIKMTYLLLWRGNYEGVSIFRYVNLEAAKVALDSSEDPGTGGLIVELEASIGMNGPSMVALFNSLGKAIDAPSVNKFTDKSEGKRRLYARIESLARNVPVLSAPAIPVEALPPAAGQAPVDQAPTEGPKEDEDVAKKKTSTRKRAAAPKTNGAGGKRSRVNGDATITVIAGKNPKRAGSLSEVRFRLYRSGMKVSAYLSKGGYGSDITYDVKHGYIKLA